MSIISVQGRGRLPRWAGAAMWLQSAWRKAVRNEASSYLTGVVNNEVKKLPAMADLGSLKVNAAVGKGVFTNTCSVCHQVNNEGLDFGPKLTEGEPILTATATLFLYVRTSVPY